MGKPLDQATCVKLAASNTDKVEAFGTSRRSRYKKRWAEGYFYVNPAAEVDDHASDLPKVERYGQTAT
jgi:hypothetical protein